MALSAYEAATNTNMPKNGPLWENYRDGRLIVDENCLAHCSEDLKQLLKEMAHPDPTQRFDWFNIESIENFEDEISC